MSAISNKVFGSMDELGPFISEILKYGSEVRITVKGNSMFPLLRHNQDSVILKNPTKLSKYDIVLFKRISGEYILHRIIKIKDDVLTIAGDNEILKEYPVNKKQVIAVVEKIERGRIKVTKRNLLYCLYSRFWLLIFPFRYEMIGFLKKIVGSFKSAKQ